MLNVSTTVCTLRSKSGNEFAVILSWFHEVLFTRAGWSPWSLWLRHSWCESSWRLKLKAQNVACLSFFRSVSLPVFSMCPAVNTNSPVHPPPWMQTLPPLPCRCTLSLSTRLCARFPGQKQNATNLGFCLLPAKKSIYKPWTHNHRSQKWGRFISVGVFNTHRTWVFTIRWSIQCVDKVYPTTVIAKCKLLLL